jgi:hypothetical protein
LVGAGVGAADAQQDTTRVRHCVREQQSDRTVGAALPECGRLRNCCNSDPQARSPRSILRVPQSTPIMRYPTQTPARRSAVHFPTLCDTATPKRRSRLARPIRCLRVRFPMGARQYPAVVHPANRTPVCPKHCDAPAAVAHERCHQSHREVCNYPVRHERPCEYPSVR